MAQDLYLMSPPSRGWALRGRANFRSESAAPVDAKAARREWLALAEAIEAAGARVAVLIPEDDTLTGLPYAAEAGHVLPPRAPGERHRFLLPRMWAPHRKAERERWAPFARAIGFELVDPGAGIWEAQGDVASFDGVTLMFYGGRSDRDGMNAAMAHFDGEILALELRQPAFHGNMAVLPLPAADRLLVCPDVILNHGVQRLLDRFGSHRVVPVTEPEIQHYATNGLPVADRWLVPSVAPDRVKHLVAGFGLRVLEIAMPELCEKAGGASRCLVCHAPGAAAAATLPPDAQLTHTAREIRADD